ncbi:MAG: hypothetical protein NC089_04755 [Bacteroides sp.]|nr:hypothetical protein [Bacteroides sp.]MCM1548705.1 hypothetical protein [Clostridium sp.]
MAIEMQTLEKKKKNAIDLLITMIIDELAEDMQVRATELLPRFMTSNTGRLLYEEESKLWWNGPSDIAEMFKNEIGKRTHGDDFDKIQ